LKIRNCFVVIGLLFCFGVSQAQAQLSAGDQEKPMSLVEMQEMKKTGFFDKKKPSGKDKLENIVDEEKDLELKIRRDSMRDAARSYGARGGLSWRTAAIMEELKKSGNAMDKSFNFRRLLIKAPSNLFIEPPIISEALNNFIVSPNGGEAAVADRIYQITSQARIVSTSRNWRQYLERDWKEVAPPPDILLPENDKEREAWRRWVAEGWEQGTKQADEIFQSDLDLLSADFEGMIRYRRLLAENKVSPPYATLIDRGVSGVKAQTMVGSRPMSVTTQMRVGDRAIRITSPSSLQDSTEGADWTPGVEAAP
jgi:defect-in-organelle-trafficking protein DotC